MEEEKKEQIVDKSFQEKITEEEKADREITTTTEISKAIKGMKNTKTGNKNN